MRKDLLRSVCIGIMVSFALNVHIYSQGVGKKELFQSIENQEVDLLKEYMEKNINLRLYDEEDKSLMYVAVDNWNIPAVEILLEHNAAFSYHSIKKLLRSKIDSEEKLSISRENYNAHSKIMNHIDPFDSYKVVDSKKSIENFSPVLSPPSYSEIQQIFNKAKPQFELIIARRMRSGLNSNLNYAGLSTGAGIVLPLFKNYSSQLKCGEKKMAINHGKDGKIIYLDNDVYQLDQLDIQQSLRQRFSLYFQLTGIYTMRITGMLPVSPEFIQNITTEEYMLDIRSLDISPSLIFKYGLFYLKFGMEIRKAIKTSVLWPVYPDDSEYERADISENAQPYTSAFVLGAGVDVQFAYIEFGKSFAPTDAFQGVKTAVNWSGLSVGVRL